MTDPGPGGADRLPTRIAGDAIESRNERVQKNLGLVFRVARQYVNRGLMLEDLIGEGNLGLIRAADQYDPASGARFSTYATYWIREAIQSALANTARTIRLPMNVSRLLGRWRRTERALRRSQGHPPTFDEVAATMGLDARVRRSIARVHRLVKVGMTLDPEEVRPRGAALLDDGGTPEETLAAREEREVISRRFERLERAERAVLALRYGLSDEPPMAIGHISGRLGMTRAAVQRLFATAMRKLAGHDEVPPRVERPACEGRVG